MTDRNTWWIDDLDPGHINTLGHKPADLLHLHDDGAWAGLSDEHEFGGHAAYCHPDLAPFLQRALRLREGRHPVTGEVLPEDTPATAVLHSLLEGP